MSAENDILKPLIIEALEKKGGMATILEVSKHIHENHQEILASSGDLLYRWHYVLRWAGLTLRKEKILLPSQDCERGVWALA
mgnify:CR=1 FL=1